MPSNTYAAVRRALLRWFRNHARALPWRGTMSPYAVWVSEVMLQQTPVATVVPYFERFLSAFPSVENLARAPQEKVLELWSGLGYYRRARLLRQAAREIVEKFGGSFPADYHQARSLPGVGDYTAKAVLSIAYRQPYTVFDGNVARVVARLAAVPGHANQPQFRRQVERRLEPMLSRRSPGDFNQAIMELGQTLCLPRGPRCDACPVRRWCEARKLGQPERFPAPKLRRAVEHRHLAVAVISRPPGAKRRTKTRDSIEVAMVRGLDENLLSDLWNFPAAFGRVRRAAFENLESRLASMTRGRLEWRHRSRRRPEAQLRHGITYRSIVVDLYTAEIKGRTRSFRWFALRDLPRAAVSQLARKVAVHVAELYERRTSGGPRPPRQ